MSDTTEMVMPSPAEDVREATLAVWLKRPGEAVAAGDVIAEALTDKVNVEIAAPDSGVLEEILVEEGAVVPVGTPIARLRTGPHPSPSPPGRGAHGAPASAASRGEGQRP